MRELFSTIRYNLPGIWYKNKTDMNKLCAGLLILASSTLVRAQGSGSEFRWAGDPEGGAPYVEASPSDPNTLVGFDVEIADLIARGLGRTPRFVLVNFYSIDQSVARGDADIGMSGIEDTVSRRTTMAVTVPYYAFREVLSVRDGDAARYRTLSDLAGRRVATLAGTIAYDILLRAEREYGLTAVSYEDDVHPYSDLVLGRVDAVLLDNILADRRQRTISGFTIQPAVIASSHYVGVLSAGNRRCAIGQTTSSGRGCATAPSNESFASGRSGTTISRHSTKLCWPAKRFRPSPEPIPARARRRCRGGGRHSGISQRCSRPRSLRFCCRASP
jgi:polar amino acid transport system substrate-binding protein